MRGRQASFVKRIPKRYRRLFPEAQTHMRRPAHTNSWADAERRWPQVEAEWDAHFWALAAGRSANAVRHLEDSRSLAEARCFAYLAADNVVSGHFAEIVRRRDALIANGNPTEADADALLGTVAAPRPSSSPSRGRRPPTIPAAGLPSASSRQARSMPWCPRRPIRSPASASELSLAGRTASRCAGCTSPRAKTGPAPLTISWWGMATRR